MKAGIFDLDGTLIEDGDDEKARKGVRNLLELTALAKDFEAIILTARTEEIRGETEDLASRLDLKYDRLYMRPDSRIDEPDHVFKRKTLEELRDEGIKVDFAIEDKETVADMWENERIKCLRIPEKHSLEHRITDKLRKTFPYLPESLKTIYLKLYRYHFSR